MRGVRAGVVLLAAVGLAATAPAPAVADDGLAAAVPDASTLAAEVVVEVESAVGSALGDVLPTLPVDVPLELPDEPAPEAPPQAPPPVPEPQPDAPAQAAQTAPANVNVSVRVDSPGDDGPVGQVNTVVAAAPPQYPRDDSQYQPVVPAPDVPAPVAAAPAAPDPPTVDPTWEWTWDWDCADGAAPSVEVPPDVASAGWTWNWNWECGDGATPTPDPDAKDDVSGYHSQTAQYRPVNVNVSIRINSPGANGPVTQTNLALGIVLPSPPPAAPSPLPAPWPVGARAPPHGFTLGARLLLAYGPATVVAELSGSALEPEPASPAATEVIDELLPRPASARPRAAAAPERPASVLAGGRGPAAADIAPLPVDVAAVVARHESKARGAAHAAEAAPRPQARPAPRAPRRQQGEEEGPAAAPHDSLGLAPVGGPERTLPFAALVLLAFMFASSHTTLVAARSRPTHAAEADAPPDRPG